MGLPPFLHFLSFQILSQFKFSLTLIIFFHITPLASFLKREEEGKEGEGKGKGSGEGREGGKGMEEGKEG